MKSKLGECPICGSKKIERHIGPLKVQISKGKFIKTPDVEHEKCESCGETITDYEAEKVIDESLAQTHYRKAA
ncbi:MAG: YgiT-type zinc finger protein [Deltaproteobacteria bacterium]|nr:YgiT-type zinc finger protein [Deltaproteobacteria bacterium]